MVIHEFDIAMANVSIRLAQDLMVDILINNVSVRRTRSGYATYTDKQHYGISSDMLARKWGIGLDKEKRTLQSTTQYHAISYLKPLTRRHRTDLLPQRLSGLNFGFYTDTIFAKDKSIVWNTCAQIFIYLIIMRSK